MDQETAKHLRGRFDKFFFENYENAENISDEQKYHLLQAYIAGYLQRGIELKAFITDIWANSNKITVKLADKLGIE